MIKLLTNQFSTKIYLLKYFVMLKSIKNCTKNLASCISTSKFTNFSLWVRATKKRQNKIQKFLTTFLKFKFIAKSTCWDMQCDQGGCFKVFGYTQKLHKIIKNNKFLFKKMWLNLTSKLHLKKVRVGLKN